MNSNKNIQNKKNNENNENKLGDECMFKKLYEEPTEEYNVISMSVFYMDKYIRHYKNYSKDISVKRQKQFLYNLTLNIQNLDQGFLQSDDGKKWYIRIFFDKSLYKFKIGNNAPWKQFIEIYKNHPSVQFVEFYCNNFINKQKKKFT